MIEAARQPMQPCPLVTIGVPLYNAMPFVDKALAALRVQTYPNLRFVVSDNASTDGTYEVCQRYSREDPRFELHRQPVNMGAVANFEFVRRLASGEYFCWAAGDDEWAPDFVERLAAELIEHPAAAVAICAVEYISEQDVVGETIRYPDINDLSGVALAGLIMTPIAAVKSQKYNLLLAGLFRRRVLDGIIDRSPAVIDAGDRPFLAITVLGGGARYVDRPLYRKRRYATPFRVRSPDDPIARRRHPGPFRRATQLVWWTMSSRGHTTRQKLGIVSIAVKYGVVLAGQKALWSLVGSFRRLTGGLRA